MDLLKATESSPMPPMAHLKAPAMLFRRLGMIDGAHPLDELVASAPLMLIASTVMALTPEERRRHWVSCAIGKLDSAELMEIAGSWWGRSRESRRDSDISRPSGAK
jgi:hypothetical protein